MGPAAAMGRMRAVRAVEESRRERRVERRNSRLSSGERVWQAGAEWMALMAMVRGSRGRRRFTKEAWWRGLKRRVGAMCVVKNGFMKMERCSKDGDALLGPGMSGRATKWR